MRKFGDIIRLYLRDELGANVSLENVGTGVSQLVPVLVALMALRNVVIHQPELHLHPRLQSALGDVILERLPLRGRFLCLIESHSEHLMLRVLRRIRETTRRAAGMEEFALHSEHLSVVYFDKQSGEPTRVKHLRVNPNGEFIDRWPHGFFTERDDDVFFL